MNFSADVLHFASEAEEKSQSAFRRIEAISEYCTNRVLGAFQENRVSSGHFAPTTGYGYDDIGRDTLDQVYACAFGCEDALVRPQIINGTHALNLMLRGILPPSGGRFLSLTGKPYDTLMETLSVLEKSGTVIDRVDFSGAPGEEYLLSVREKIADFHPDVAYIQRSKGYGDRITLTLRDIRLLSGIVKEILPDCIVAVDNCYGEFTEPGEPFGKFPEDWQGSFPCHWNPEGKPEASADIGAGSLIKNPGGGLVPCGGYIAGRHDLVESVSMALTVPGIGREAGANPMGWRLFYQGFFMAPHIVAQALKTAVFGAHLLSSFGFTPLPSPDEPRSDIIQTIVFPASEPLIKFAAGIQAASPVESYVTPEPWAMPGYQDPVIMAAGTFVQGSSIELSCDAPIRPPYILYLQGGLTYESGKLAMMSAAEGLLATR